MTIQQILRNLNERIDTITYEEFKTIEKQINKTTISKKQKTSYISLSIRYYYKNKNYDTISSIINTEVDLMKRDYLLYLTYLYKIDIKQAIELFKKVAPKYEFFPKDIKYIIDHQMYNLLYNLENYYYYLDTDTNHLTDFSKLKLINPITNNTTQLLDFITKKFKNPNEKIKLDKYLVGVDVIIDGGNLSYFNGKGKPTYKYFKNIITMAQTKYISPLLIIHPRHLKNKIVQETLHSTKIRYFVTTIGINDDHYIIYSIIKNSCDVVTKDNFKDHIFELSTHIGDKHNFIKNYIQQKIIYYTENYIHDTLKYSKCIQIIAKKIYIPTNKGFVVF